MRSKVTVVLLFLNVVLFAYIYYFEKVKDPGAGGASHRVFSAEIANLDSFTRTMRTGETVKLERRGESWWLAKPYEWPASADAIAHVRKELELLEGETRFPVADLAKSGQSLADYGLDDPAMTLDLSAEEASKLGGIELVPGMPVEAFIANGQRTLFDYLIEPIRDRMAHAMRER